MKSITLVSFFIMFILYFTYVESKKLMKLTSQEKEKAKIIFAPPGEDCPFGPFGCPD
jgi:hypothetical protein